ncbi:MAG TPA: DUF2254 family protein [Pseudomonadales bacterium]
MRPQITPHADRQPLVRASKAFLALAGAAFGLLLITAALGGAAIVLDPRGWYRALDDQSVLEAASNTAEVVAAVLAIAITVVAIVVELAATRYSHLITRLFMREPVNIAVLGLFLVTTIQCVWTAVTFADVQADAVLPHAGFIVTFLLVTASLLCLLPYIYFVFTFLSPISVIERICRNAVGAMRFRGNSLEAAERQVLAAIDELQDVSRGAIEQGDRSIAMSGINGLTAIVYDYAQIRTSLPESWFEISEAISRDPDFIALTDDSVDQVAEDRIWLETKVFRQLYSLMSQSAGHSRDVANLIGINTSLIAQDLGNGNPALLRLCVRAFNSYLRATINARDARTAYYLMDQYRDVAEYYLSRDDGALAQEIAGYFKLYGQTAHQNGMSFLLDAAAYDVVHLIEKAVAADSGCVDGLLSVLLELDQEIKEEYQEDSLLGVRRSQIQLATLFLKLGDEARVARIVADLKAERLSRLNRLKQGLEQEGRPQYWELTDRGANFSYLDPERRQYLEPLFERLRG